MATDMAAGAPAKAAAAKTVAVEASRHQDHQNIAMAQAQHLPHPLDPLPRPTAVPTDRIPQSRQSSELPEPKNSRCCNRHLDNQSYTCIVSSLVLQMTGGKLLVCVVGGGDFGGDGSYGYYNGGGCGGGNGGSLPITDWMMMYGIVML